MIPHATQLRLSALDEAVRVGLARTGGLGDLIEPESSEVTVARAEVFYEFLAQ